MGIQTYAASRIGSDLQFPCIPPVTRIHARACTCAGRTRAGPRETGLQEARLVPGPFKPMLGRATEGEALEPISVAPASAPGRGANSARRAEGPILEEILAPPRNDATRRPSARPFGLLAAEARLPRCISSATDSVRSLSSMRLASGPPAPATRARGLPR